MRVVHLAITPLAGAPIRICQALQDRVEVDARLVVREDAPYGGRTFPNDLVWRRDQDEARRLIDRADLLVIHNQVGPEGHYFANDLDLAAIHDGGKPMLRLLHSPPDFLVSTGPWRTEHDLMSDRSLPTAVIAQGQERFYPWAVPLRTPIGVDAKQARTDARGAALRIAFSPTSDAPAAIDRWSSKGRAETMCVLESIQRRFAAASREVDIDLLVDLPFEEAIHRRGRAHLAIDEVVTGNFHLSSLESMRLGVPVIGHLDAPLRDWLRERTGGSGLPWIEATLDNLETVLGRLIDRPDQLNHAGAEGRVWTETHWSDTDAAHDHRTAYERLLSGEWPDAPRFDLREYMDWWNRFGRVEANRWERRVETATRPTRAEVTALLELIDTLAGDWTGTTTVVTDRPAFFRSPPDEAISPNWRFVDIGSQAAPASIPPADTLILVDALEHRPPSQARALFELARFAARRRLVVVAPKSDKAGGHHRFDSSGGIWKHDWPAWGVPSSGELIERGLHTIAILGRE